MKLTRRSQVVASLVAIVVLALAGYSAYLKWGSDPYAGLVTSTFVEMPDEYRETFRQRMTVTRAAIDAAVDAGEEVDITFYLSLYDDAAMLGDLVAGREALEVALDINALNPAIWNSYGTLLERMTDYEFAEEAYRQAIAIMPAEEYYRDLVEFIVAHYPDRTDEVEQILLQGVEKVGQTPWFMVRLALWYEERGNCDQAISHMKVAKTLAPDNEGVAKEMERLQAECK